MSKKLFTLVIAPMLLASSCSLLNNQNKLKLAANIDTFLLDKPNDYLTPNIDKISTNLRLNANFIIYFTEEGCSSCEGFKPIMDNYIQSQNVMVYKFDVNKDKEVFDQFKEQYGQKFFNQEAAIPLPSVYIVNEDKVSNVEYETSMKTQNAFLNYMNTKYEVGNTYYIDKNPFEFEFTNKEFAYINFDFSDENLLGLYNSKLKDKVYKSKRKVIVSSLIEDNQLHLRLVGRTELGQYSRLEFVVTDETSEEVIDKIL